MRLSSPDSPKPPEKKSILLIGPPGGGKTTLMMQFPNLCILDCDRNLDGPEGMIKRGLKDAAGKLTKPPLNPNLRYWYEPIYEDDQGKIVLPEHAFDYLMRKLDEIKTNREIQVVGIDSLTLVNEYIIRKIMAAQKNETMEARDWIPFKTKFLELLAGKIRNLGKHVICTVHEVIQWENDPKNIMVKHEKRYEPSVQGSIADFFGAFFTDMWRCESRVGGQNKVEFYLHTQRTAKSDLKNSMGLPTPIMSPTYQELSKYFDFTK